MLLHVSSVRENKKNRYTYMCRHYYNIKKVKGQNSLKLSVQNKVVAKKRFLLSEFLYYNNVCTYMYICFFYSTSRWTHAATFNNHSWFNQFQIKKFLRFSFPTQKKIKHVWKLYLQLDFC